MPRPKKAEQPKSIGDVIERAQSEILSIEDMPLNSMGDYVRYNAEARRLNKKLKLCRYPIKPCPIEFHPMERIEFARKDQPMNTLNVFLSNDMIDFKITLAPGKVYDLPRCVVDYLASKAVPIWKWFDKPDGSKETRIATKDPRFSLRTIYQD